VVKRFWSGAKRGPAAALIAVAFAGSALSACNSSDNVTVSTTIVPPPPGCDTARVDVIGASLDLSGPAAAVGRQYLMGLELGIAKVNQGNGVPPRNTCFELAYKNNQGNPAIDNQALLDLVNVEKAQVVVGQFLGSATANYLGQLGVVAVSLSNLESIYEPKLYPNTFPMTASMESQAFAIGKALKADGVSSVGVIATRDAASRQGAAHLAQVSANDGFTITATATVSPSGAGAASAISTVRASDPKELVVLDDTGAVGAVLAARAAAGWRVPVIAGPTATTANVVSRISGDLEGVSVEVPNGAVEGSGPGASATVGFQRLLDKHLGTIRGSIIPYAETYDAMTMIGAAAVGAMAILATDVTTFMQNANYQGVLASYTYTSGAHTGVPASSQVAVPLDSLSNGLLKAPPKPKKATVAAGS
jgi:ABC-type branched-subunit amino acid transport system substrate-binding protein